MDKHWHSGAEHILLYGLSALIVFNLIKIIAAKAVSSSNNFVQTAGKVGGSLVHM
jgi:hypothetical protein